MGILWAHSGNPNACLLAAAISLDSLQVQEVGGEHGFVHPPLIPRHPTPDCHALRSGAGWNVPKHNTLGLVLHSSFLMCIVSV